MMAAIGAARAGAQVSLLEKNEKLGKKIYITGKGRCNVTNACDISEFFDRVVSNPRFLYSALYGFTNDDLRALLEAEGCALKVERGERVFPVSDHAYDVTDALKHCLRRYGVEVRLNTEVKRILLQDGRVTGVALCAYDSRQDALAAGVGSVDSHSESHAGIQKAGGGAGNRRIGSDSGKTAKGEEILACDRVIIATGGMSYSSTGSTGDGYRFAKQTGLAVTSLYPALVPLETEETDCQRMQGLSLKNVALEIRDEKGKCYASDFGELLFTHFGLSGPVVLSASSHVTKYLNAQDMKGRRLLTVHLDLKPALSEKQLDERLLRDFSEMKNKQLRNAFQKLFPAKLIPVFLDRLAAEGVQLDKQVNEVTREERRVMLGLIKDFSFTLSGTRRFNEAIITQGGVAVKELNPATMEAKKVPGLYFAGEVIDIDAYTGGFNLQLAFSTGHLAGVSAASL